MRKVVLMVGLLVSASAAAQSTAVVAASDCQSGASAAPARALRDALAKRPNASVQSESATAKPLGGLSTTSTAEIDRQLAAAHADISRDAYAEAEKTLLAARDALTTQPPTEARWTRMQNAAALLAWAEEKQGRPEDARASLARILAVQPDFAPAHNIYPPRVAQLAREAETELKSKSRGTLSVTSKPAGQPVFVDGKPAGNAPALLQLPRGEHRVELGLASGRGLPRDVHLDESAFVELDAAFDGAVWPDSGPCVEAGTARDSRLKTLVTLGHALNAKTLVALRLDEPAPGEKYLVATTIDVDSGQEAREAKTRADAPSGIEKLADFIATGDVAPPVEPLRGGNANLTSATEPKPAASTNAGELKAMPESNGGASGMRIGAYVCTGVGAAALLSAAYFAYDFKSQNDQLTNVQNPDGSFDASLSNQVKSGQSAMNRDRSMVYVSSGVALVSAAAAVTLFVMSSDSGSSASTSGAAIRLTPNGLAGRF